MKAGFRMNELGFHPFFNTDTYRYEDDSLNNIAAIVFVVFLFNGFNGHKNKKGVCVSPAALLLLLIFILLRYRGSNRLSENNSTYNIELEKYGINMNIKDKNLKDDNPYLGGYMAEDANKSSNSTNKGASAENSSVYLGGYDENIDGKPSDCFNKSYVIESSSKYVESYEEDYDSKQANSLNETYIKSNERNYSGSFQNSSIGENVSYGEGSYYEIIGNSSESDSVERYIFKYPQEHISPNMECFEGDKFASEKFSDSY
jgi:hypothetical protein